MAQTLQPDTSYNAWNSNKAMMQHFTLVADTSLMHISLEQQLARNELALTCKKLSIPKLIMCIAPYPELHTGAAAPNDLVHEKLSWKDSMSLLRIENV